MGRLIAFLAPFAIGGVFVLALIVGALMPRDAVTPDPTIALHKEAKEVSFKSDGVFGTFDKAQLQRGFKVYQEVCAACHSLHQVAFRDLAALGFTPAEIKAIAKKNDQPTIDEKTGDAATRPGLPSDKFYGPYANEVAARAANNNALPPDLSLMTKAREHGNRYVYSLLTGYANAPAGWAVPQGLHYNPYFKSINIAMPAPLTSEGQVEYTDGTSEEMKLPAEIWRFDTRKTSKMIFTKKEIKAAYYRMAPEFHPDRWFRRELGSFKSRLEAIFTRITEAMTEYQCDGRTVLGMSEFCDVVTDGIPISHPLLDTDRGIT